MRNATLLTALVLLLAAVPAQGQSAEYHPQDLSPVGAFAPQVAVDSEGRATVVWHRYDGSIDRIESRRLRADGTAEAIRTLSAAGENARRPQVAVDSQGRATVVWYTTDSSTFHFQVQSRRLRSDGTPEPVQHLSPAGGEAFAPQIAIDPQDRATVVWYRRWAHEVQSRRIRADGTPEPIQALSSTDEHGVNARVAVDPQGRATVVWDRPSIDFQNTRVWSRKVGADGTPVGPIQTLSAEADNAFGPEVAVDAQGRATVVWKRVTPGDPFGPVGIQSRRLDAGGAPVGSIQNLSATDQEARASAPDVAVDSQGRATVIWERNESGPRSVRVQSRRLGVDGTAEGIRNLAGPSGGEARGPRVAARGDRVTAIWLRWLGPSTFSSNFRVQLVEFDGAGAPGAIQTLSGGGIDAGTRDASEPQLAIDPQGRATVVWLRDGMVQTVRDATIIPPNDDDGGPGQFALGKVKPNRKRGIARMMVRVPGPGTVVVRQTKQVRRAARKFEAAGRGPLQVRPRGKAKRRISNRRCKRSNKKQLRTRVVAKVVYRPAAGERQTLQRRVRLVKRC